MLVPHQPSAHWYEGAALISDLNDAAIDVLTNFARVDIPNKISAIVVFPMLGACLAGDPEGDAIRNRQCKYWAIVEGR
jgi:hypothetical protein